MPMKRGFAQRIIEKAVPTVAAVCDRRVYTFSETARRSRSIIKPAVIDRRYSRTGLPENFSCKVMKRIFLILVVALFAIPGFGQDIDLGLGGDASSLLNIPAPRGNTPARGAPSGRGATGAASVDRLARLRQVLAQANAPLSPDQETGLNTL